MATRKIFNVNENEEVTLRRQNIPNIAKEKNNFYKKLKVDEATRKAIKLYNWIKPQM